MWCSEEDDSFRALINVFIFGFLRSDNESLVDMTSVTSK